MKIVLLGAPGVGKGTYAKEIVKKYGWPHISSGDLFREKIKGKDSLGKKIAEYLKSGQLVPEKITLRIIKERLSQKDCQKGFLLDGFPRTLRQAQELDKFCLIDLVILFQADLAVIKERLSGRRICRQCGRIFHLINLPPKVKDRCDFCGGPLYQREDDQPQTIEKRLKIYQEQIKPLLDFYQKKGLLEKITVNEDFRQYKKLIKERIFRVIEKRKIKNKHIL